MLTALLIERFGEHPELPDLVQRFAHWPDVATAVHAISTATDLAERLPITRQAIAKHLALLAEVGMVTAEPGERRRVRYRLRSAPVLVAQQFLAALTRDWDGRLDALRDHLTRGG